MKALDTPEITSSAYANAVGGGVAGPNPFAGLIHGANRAEHLVEARRVAADAAAKAAFNQPFNPPQHEKGKPMSQRRLVKVIIADPDLNVPLEQCVLYSGEEKMTDATDQELFFEIDIKSALEKHNERRTKIIDRKVKERTEYL